MNNEVIALQITGLGETGTLIPVTDKSEQRKMLLWARTLGIEARAGEENGLPMIKMPSTIVYCELSRHRGTRKRKKKQLKAFVNKANGKPGVTITRSKPTGNHPGRQEKYVNRPSHNNHLH